MEAYRVPSLRDLLSSIRRKRFATHLVDGMTIVWCGVAWATLIVEALMNRAAVKRSIRSIADR